MASWHPLDPDFVVQVLPAPVPDAETESRVAAIWQEQRRRRGETLFDGPVYSLVAARHDRMDLVPRSYRFSVALRVDPELGQQLGVRPVGVSGLIKCRDGVVLGRRSARVFVPGCWECAPAGTLATTDPARQVLDELEEELGIAREQVSRPMALGLIEDHDSAIVDIVYALECGLGADEIASRHAAASTNEYDEIAVVARADLPGFLHDHRDSLVPILIPILRATGWLAT